MMMMRRRKRRKKVNVIGNSRYFGHYLVGEGYQQLGATFIFLEFKEHKNMTFTSYLNELMTLCLEEK